MRMEGKECIHHRRLNLKSQIEDPSILSFQTYPILFESIATYLIKVIELVLFSTGNGR